MNIKEINRQIQFKAFPRAKSTQLNHYVTPTLEKYSYDAAIVHVVINEIPRSEHYDEIDKLPGTIMKVGNTCQKYSIGKIFIYQQYFHQQEQILIFLTFKKKTNINIFDIDKKLRDLCMKYNFEFIDHQQITTKFWWNDGIYLLDTGKSILGENFVNRVSNFFVKTILF